MVQRGLKMVWSLVNQVFCVCCIFILFIFSQKGKQAKKININVWQSFSCEKVGAQRVHDRRHVVRFSDFCCQRISRIPSATAAPRNDPGWIFASELFRWRLVCRGLAQSIKLPVVGILYLSSWNFAFVLLVFCILSSSPSWGRRPELCPLYLICKVDAQVMARDGAPRYIWMDNVTSTLCNLLWFDTYFISLRAT